MKKSLSVIAAVIFCVCLVSYFNAGEKSQVLIADNPWIIISPPVKVAGKKIKTITPTKKRGTTIYQTMA